MTWKIETCDFSSGSSETRISIILMKNNQQVGIMVLTQRDYQDAMTFAASSIQKLAASLIEKNLGDLLWKDAINVFNGDTDTAMKKLGQLEINQKKIRQHSEMLAMALLKLFLDSIPEHK